MRSGRIRIVPSQARVGDFVVFLAGMPVPVLLRDIADEHSDYLNLEIQEAFMVKYK
jgi:hypothetical protein